MNKDVIYIEPEDDITDIIAKIENSKEKIIALVPPKKAGVFRSVVNIKLIAKVGTANEKTVVLVTTDPSIVRLAAAVKLPVTKNLQSAPVIPTLESVAEESAKTELVEISTGDGETDVAAEEVEESADAGNGADNPEPVEDDEATGETNETEEAPTKDEATPDEEPSKREKKAKKEPKKKPAGKGFGGWLKSHKKLAAFCGVGVVALILVLVWALVIAPAVDITVWIQTENKSFSESVSFTTTLSEEDAAEGKFYLEERKIETTQEVKFTATGQQNLGEKASGVLTVSAAFDWKNGGAMTINAGDLFSYNGLTYAADNTVPIRYDGDDDSVCANKDESHSDFKANGCLIYANVKITATEPGSEYNISPTNSGWSTILNLKGISLNEAITGGTDDIKTVVQQSDILKAKESLDNGNEAENKKRLYEGISDDFIIIEASFNQSTSDAVSTPAAGEQIGEGVTPAIKATTTSSVYVIDKTKVKEFITAKADIGDDQKVYEMEDPFIENFTKTGNGYIGKLKTSYLVGPKVTDKEVLEMARGKGIGDIQHDLKEITGIVSVETNTSYPWVVKVPNDSNKITVEIKVKDKNSQNTNNSEQEGEE